MKQMSYAKNSEARTLINLAFFFSTYCTSLPPLPQMAFQDPGAVRWAHKLEYTTTLLQLISNVQNCSRNEAKLLFNKTSRTNALRMDTLAVITDLLFDASAAGDEQVARDHKLMESLNRRLNV